MRIVQAQSGTPLRNQRVILRESESSLVMLLTTWMDERD